MKYLEESQKPSTVKHLVDGKWIEIEARPERWVNKKKRKYNPKVTIEFYLSKKWHKLRKKVLKKYGKKCMKCGETSGVIQVDHIKPRSKYPELELSFNNMQVLCILCNKEKSNKNEMDYRPKGLCV